MKKGRHTVLYILVSSIILLFFSCKKDSISRQTLNGQVINNCTDSGVANVKIYFKTLSKNTAKPTLEAVTDNNGYFTFPDVEIIHSKDYTYALYIPTISGIAANKPELTRFDGTTMSFFHDQAGTYFKPRVTPGFFQLCFVLKPDTFITSPDSIRCDFEQVIFHKNVPELPSKITLTHNYIQNGYVYCTTGFPMGLWRISLKKYKNNSLSSSSDSIYIGYQGTKTYTINW